MSERPTEENPILDSDQICHKIRGALFSLREAHDLLLEPKGDRQEAEILFKSGEEKLLDLLEILTGDRE